jgi:hypothetical protein
MSNALDKWSKEEKALDAERRLMNEALAQLGRVEVKHGAGRLIFGLDLTGSREASLRHARTATAAMFDTIKTIGAVAVKLVYYRGTECKSSAWHDDAAVVSRAMLDLSCKTGNTQIARVLKLALTEREKLSGVVFVGDHCEDSSDELLTLAATLGKLSIPLFIFHEIVDHDRYALQARPVFERMATLSGGIYTEFRPDSGAILRELLSTVAAFAAGGSEAVKQVEPAATPEARRLQGRLMLGPAGGN